MTFVQNRFFKKSDSPTNTQPLAFLLTSKPLSDIPAVIWELQNYSQKSFKLPHLLSQIVDDSCQSLCNQFSVPTELLQVHMSPKHAQKPCITSLHKETDGQDDKNTDLMSMMEFREELRWLSRCESVKAGSLRIPKRSCSHARVSSARLIFL